MLSYYNARFYEIMKFNKIARGDTPYTDVDSYYELLKAQANLVMEELQELIAGIDARDNNEIFDGILDVQVTSFYLEELIDMEIGSTEKGLAIVNMNNLTKFPAFESVAKDSVEYYNRECGEDYCRYEYREGLYVILRNSDNKILKPLGYKKVDLAEAIY